MLMRSRIFSRLGIPFFHGNILRSEDAEAGLEQPGFEYVGVGCGDDEEFVTIAAGPFTKQPGTNNYRIVLRWSEQDQKFVVHNEVVSDGKVYYDTGDYFHGEKKLPEALRRFGERVIKQAKNSESCFRD